MILKIINYLHRNGYRELLALICQTMYFFKGYGITPSRYHKAFRAYSYRVDHKTYMSIGPGWAYNFNYLHNELLNTYNHFYTPGEGDCIIDIGAGLGEETVIYSIMVGPKGRVYALEANPITFEGLRYMCNQNEFHWTVPQHLAIYNREGEVNIQDDTENYLTNTITAASSDTNGFRVRATTLDSMVRDNNITRIDFLKSNIEGAEQFLIEGMDHSIGMIRNICISCHDFRHIHHSHGEFYMTKNKVKSFLENHGFAVSIRNTGNRVVDDYIYARNTKFR